MLEAVLGGAFALAGAVLGSVLERRAARASATAAALAAHHQGVRDAIVALVVALSTHRGDLYDRWDLIHRPTTAGTPSGPETAQARHTSHASRTTVTAGLYRLRALTADTVLLRAADAAVAATYAVKAKGEDLAHITPQDLADRRRQALAADGVLLTASATRLAP